MYGQVQPSHTQMYMYSVRGQVYKTTPEMVTPQLIWTLAMLLANAWFKLHRKVYKTTPETTQPPLIITLLSYLLYNPITTLYLHVPLHRYNLCLSSPRDCCPWVHPLPLLPPPSPQRHPHPQQQGQPRQSPQM